MYGLQETKYRKQKEKDHRQIIASYSISAGWRAFLPVPSFTWCLQLVPGAAMITSSGCLRTSGKRTSSPICIDRSKCSFSYPKDPAIPQQPEGMVSTL